MGLDVILWKEKKRPPIKQSVRKELLFRSKGKCERCGKNLISAGIPYHVHHKDGNRKNNRMSNLMLVCPNCHERLTHFQRLRGKFTKKERTPFDIEIPKIELPDLGLDKPRRRRKKSDLSLF